MPIKWFWFCQPRRGRGRPFVGKNDVNYAIDGDTVEVVIKKVADRNKEQQQKPKLLIS